MLCAISGEAPSEAVVSKYGTLMERRLAVKYIAEHGKDPVSGEPLSEEDLVVVKSATPIVRPRPPAATSIPALLASMQNEWDALTLETFELRNKYKEARKELTTALYQHDAACRVIARLTRERDEARAALANVKETLGAAPAVAADGDRMDVDKPAPKAGEGITDDILEKMVEVSQSLSKVRRKRKPAPTLASLEAVASFQPRRQINSLHSSTNPGILALDLLAAANLAVTGGKDGALSIVNVASGKVLGEVPKAHGSKKVTCVSWTGREENSRRFLSGGADKVVRLWEAGDDGAEGKYQVKNAHTQEVSGVTVHASGDYFVSTGHDGVWAFGVVEDGRVVQKVSHDEVQSYTTCQFHPDGLILGTGTTDGSLRLWDVKAQSNVATFTSHAGKLNALAFSENGYTVATGSDGEGTVRIWDLRKLEQVATVETGAKNVHSVAFDWSGQYLAVASGADVGVYPNKTFDPPILQLASAHDGKEVTGVAFGTDATYLLSSGMDRVMRVYSE